MAPDSLMHSAWSPRAADGFMRDVGIFGSDPDMRPAAGIVGRRQIDWLVDRQVAMADPEIDRGINLACN